MFARFQSRSKKKLIHTQHAVCIKLEAGSVSVGRSVIVIRLDPQAPVIAHPGVVANVVDRLEGVVAWVE